MLLVDSNGLCIRIEKLASLFALVVIVQKYGGSSGDRAIPTTINFAIPLLIGISVFINLSGATSTFFQRAAAAVVSGVHISYLLVTSS